MHRRGEFHELTSLDIFPKISEKKKSNEISGETLGRIGRVTLKKIVFAGLPLLILLLAVTVGLNFLEQKQVIDTVRKDDGVVYFAGDVFMKSIINDQAFYHLEINHLNQFFPVRKNKDTIRIITTGASFALGQPWVYLLPNGEGSIPEYIKADLQERFPKRHFEVINAAQEAQNSFRVKQIVEQLLMTDPDIILVMMGNNEGYVPKTRFNQSLHKWIVYRSLKKTLLSKPQLSERSYFAPQDEDYKKIEKGFQDNVRSIVEMAGCHSVRLILTAMPINLRYYGNQPPLNDIDIPFPENDPHIDEGDRLRENGEYEKAIAQYAKSRNQGFAARLIAQCYEALGDAETAKTYYRIYTQQIPLNRTRPSFNDFIRRICREQNIALLDLEQAIESLSPDGIADPDLFIDYCHMSKKGYFLMGREAARVVAENLPIPEGEYLRNPQPSLDDLLRKMNWSVQEKW